MATLTIYVPDDLAVKVRASDINISATCQAALARKIRLRERDPKAADAARAEGSRKYPAGRAS